MRVAAMALGMSSLAGIPPNRLSWGNLTAQEFLTVDDLTTWSLTHFEPVFARSGAEEMTAVEEQEGYGIVGRGRRQVGRPTIVQTATAHDARSPNRGFAVRQYGLHTRYWRPVMGTHPIVCPVPYRKSARLHEFAAQLASAENGWRSTGTLARGISAPVLD